jgi:hypothetical protein
MADISDVLDVLASLVTGLMYPNGTGAQSAVGTAVRAYPGWPVAANLDSDLKAGKVNVSVFPTAVESNRTRYLRKWQSGEAQPQSIFLTASANLIVVSGQVPAPFVSHNLAVLISNVAYLYPVQPSDTLTSIAAAIASLLAVDYPGTSSVGGTITMGQSFHGAEIVTRGGTVATASRELKRQQRLVQITVWAPTPDLRTRVASALDVAFADIAFLAMPDGSAARLMYHDTPMTDMLEKAHLYRRDLRYFVEYATTQLEQAAVVVDGKVVRQDPVTGVTISIKHY